MATERSDALYHAWREAAQKFDYFVLAVTGAICAYIAQSFEAERLGMNPGTLTILALFALVCAAITGFRRIESANLLMQVNSAYLRAQEERGSLMPGLDQPVLNRATGEVYSPEQVHAILERHAASLPGLKAKIDEMGRKAERNYSRRNSLLLLGFTLLVGAKVWAAYV